MEAIILAGGFGKRLREVVPHLPKPMAPIMGKPFLEILLRSLANKGFKRVVLSLGYMAESIISHFGNFFLGIELIYIVEEKPLGTGGAVRLALLNCQQDHTYIFNGDTYLDLEIDKVEKLWFKNQNPIIIGREVPDALRYGRLMVEEGNLIAFTEKGFAGPGLINAGCYVFNSSQLDDFPPNTPFSLEDDYLSKVVQRTSFNIFVTTGLFIDIGVPQDYVRAQNLLNNLDRA